MAKPLFPSKKRGPGRSAQRVKPGEVIRGELMSSPKGASIGDCHRLYTKLKLEDWQNQQKLRLANLEERVIKKLEKQSDRKLTHRDMLKERASQVHPRSARKQAAFIVRKEKATAKIMARKRAPGNVTYENFSKFFHLLKQLGYIAPITEKDFITGKVTKKHGIPKSSEGQIEPPVIYQITDLGQSVSDWNNPKKDLA